jgi:hypothetical protein
MAEHHDDKPNNTLASLLTTPVPIPVWESLNELTVVSFTLPSLQEAIGSDTNVVKSVFGTDRVMIRAVGRVRLGIDMSEIKDSDIVRNGDSIRIKLPRVRVFMPELLPEKTEIISSQQRWLFSEYPGLELQAMAKAKADMYTHAQENSDFRSLAEELTRLRFTEYLRKYGYSNITITFAEE